MERVTLIRDEYLQRRADEDRVKRVYFEHIAVSSSSDFADTLCPDFSLAGAKMQAELRASRRMTAARRGPVENISAVCHSF